MTAIGSAVAGRRPARGATDRDAIRVLHVGKYYHPYRGGMETHLRELCERLSGDFDVSVVVANEARRTLSERVGGVNVTRLASLATVASAPLTPGLASAMRAVPADIVHVHHPNPVATVAYLRARPPGRLVVTYHSDIVRQRLLARLFEPLLHRFLDAADAIICTSPNYIESSRILRRHRARCRVLPFSLCLDRFDRVDPRAVEAVRARHPGPLVLAVGRLVGYKGFEHLVRAMADVSATLLLIGNGPLHGTLRALADGLGVGERVVILDDVPDVVPYFHAADVFALPSVARSEAFGLVQLEAMACAKPVVNTALASGVPYVSVDGETGLTVPPGDAGALGHALNRLLGDPQLSRRLGVNGRQRAERMFSVEAMVRGTAAVYEELSAEVPA